MAQLALEMAYEFFVEILCYGTGHIILKTIGFRNLLEQHRYDFVVGMIGFLFWFAVGLLVWQFFGV